MYFNNFKRFIPLVSLHKRFYAAGGEKDHATYHNKNFNLMTFRDYNITKITDDHGLEKEFACNERYYIPGEMTWLLKTVGFKNIEIFGAKLGAFYQMIN